MVQKRLLFKYPCCSSLTLRKYKEPNRFGFPNSSLFWFGVNRGGGLTEIKWKNGRRVYFSVIGNKVILLLIGGYKNAQNKEIKKQEFSLEDMQKVKIKKGVKVLKDNSLKNLKDRDRVKETLSTVLASCRASYSQPGDLFIR